MKTLEVEYYTIERVFKKLWSLEFNKIKKEEKKIFWAKNIRIHMNRVLGCFHKNHAFYLPFGMIMIVV